jgi:hypothetical protein
VSSNTTLLRKPADERFSPFPRVLPSCRGSIVKGGQRHLMLPFQRYSRPRCRNPTKHRIDVRGVQGLCQHFQISSPLNSGQQRVSLFTDPTCLRRFVSSQCRRKRKCDQAGLRPISATPHRPYRARMGAKLKDCHFDYCTKYQQLNARPVAMTNQRIVRCGTRRPTATLPHPPRMLAVATMATAR